jgi:hypothetical protein
MVTASTTLTDAVDRSVKGCDWWKNIGFATAARGVFAAGRKEVAPGSIRAPTPSVTGGTSMEDSRTASWSIVSLAETFFTVNMVLPEQSYGYGVWSSLPRSKMRPNNLSETPTSSRIKKTRPSESPFQG